MIEIPFYSAARPFFSGKTCDTLLAKKQLSEVWITALISRAAFCIG